MTRGSLRLRHSSAHQARYEFRLTDVVIVVGGQHRPAMGHRAIQPGPRLDGASPGIFSRLYNGSPPDSSTCWFGPKGCESDSVPRACSSVRISCSICFLSRRSSEIAFFASIKTTPKFRHGALGRPIVRIAGPPASHDPRAAQVQKLPILVQIRRAFFANMPLRSCCVGVMQPAGIPQVAIPLCWPMSCRV